MAVLYRHGWITDVTGTITDGGRTAVGEPTTAAVAAQAERSAADRAAHSTGCRSWIDGDDHCDCTDEDTDVAAVVVGERPAGVTRGPAWRLSGGTPIVAREAPEGTHYRHPDLRDPVPAPVVHDHRPAAVIADEAGLPVEAIGPCAACPVPAEDEAPEGEAPEGENESPAVGAPAPSRFGAVWAVVVVLAALLSFAVNAGPGVATVVAHATAAPAPAAAPVVASSAPLPAPVGAPRVGAGVGARCEEDMPCWDCTRMGNHRCGPGAAVRTPRVWILQVPAHPNGVIFASVYSRPFRPAGIHASVCAMTNPQTATPHADARADARRAAERPALVAWENLTGDESPAELDAILRAATDEARAHVLPARTTPRVCDVVTGYRGTGTIVSALHTGDVLVDWRDGHQTWVRASAVRVIGHDS